MITSDDGRTLYRVELRRVVYVLAIDGLEAETTAEELPYNPAEVVIMVVPATAKRAESDGWTGHPFYSPGRGKQALTVGQFLKISKVNQAKSRESGKVT